MGTAVVQQGYGRPSLTQALLDREAQHPTGLPLPARAVAIPHADPQHVLAPAVAFCTLAQPVPFSEMGNPGHLLPVEIVAVLAFTDAQSGQNMLTGLLGLLQDDAFSQTLVDAPDAAALYHVLCSKASV